MVEGKPMGRVVLGGLLAGVVVFCWGAAAHMALPLGTIGVHKLPNEDGILAAFRGSITEPGFYFFPGIDHSKPVSQSETEAVIAKIKQGPAGVLVIHPEGRDAMSPRQLGTELATNVVSALLAAWLLSKVASGYVGRVLFVTVMGIFGFITVSVPYWNWYGFPTDFTLAEAIDHVVGWFLAGLVLAAIVRPIAPKPV
jgi:hypothetical protein